MKVYITIFNLFLVCNLFSQGKPPTADEIRQAISGKINSFKIPPQPVYKVENTAVWNGTDSIKVRLYYPKAGKNQRITLIVTSEKDMLKPHGTELYEKLQQANVSSKLVDIPNKDHLSEYWAAAHPYAQPAIDETVNFIMASPNK